MITLFIKEIRSFLSSLIAIVVIVVFLIAMGLFIWVFPETNVLDFGYSNLDTLFSMSPWIFIFLISAITMRSFSEEKRMGTYESLATKPLTDLQIVFAKFCAGMVLVIFSLIPTLIYFYTIYKLGAPEGNIDTGATWGSYIGLLFLGSCYVSIGLFSSSVTENQIISFILSMFLCFFCFSAFEQLSKLSVLSGLDYLMEWVGINYHYQSISRGVLDTRDVVYFLSFTTFFLGLTYRIISKEKS
ncbi:MAG: gliding motility-associated ABC transporter permease subunit GldF [Flavobacteriales bacterium]|nr:gliding motility-associated ABC transporter permease subunit GldF [Flavobacteriales bacterium]